MNRRQRNRLERYAAALAEGERRSLLDLGSVVDLPSADIERAIDTDRLAEGTVDSRVIVQALPRALVEQWLPQGLELAPQPLTMPNRHPVIVRLTEEHAQWLGQTVDSRELSLEVPWVQLADPHVPNRGPFIYSVRRYVDGQRPRLCAEHLVGLEACAATLELGDDSSSAHDEQGPLAEASFEVAGAQVDPAAQPGLERLRGAFEQPTVSQALRVCNPDAVSERSAGPFLGTVDRLDLDAPGAVITPLRATVTLTERFGPPSMPATTLRAEALVDGRLGAFRIVAPRRLSLPTTIAAVRFPEPPPLPLERRQRVLVLGGGPASCATAFYLAKTGRYRVSLYTLGFRLGGKCAAGRNLERARRIEEHGPHVFIGFYNNVFRTMQEICEHAATPPLSKGDGPWTEADLARGEGPFAHAVTGTSEVGLMGKWSDGEGAESWEYLPTTVGVNELVPGQVPHDPQLEPQGFSRAMKIVVQRATTSTKELREWELARCEARRNRHDDDDDDDDDELDMLDMLDRALDDLGDRFERAEQRWLFSGLDRLKAWIEKTAFDELTRSIEANTAPIRLITAALERLRTIARQRYQPLIDVDPYKWHEWSGLDFTLTVMIGIFTDRVTHLDALDEHDLKDWLISHGISAGNQDSPVVLSIYDTLFTNAPSPPVRPGYLAAGVALRWFLLLTDFRGFQAYVLRHSCPETMFSPYYRALRSLGVDVCFFHKVEALQVERREGERVLVGVKMQRQATVKGGPAQYDPLWLPPDPVDEEGFTPWPNRPDYEQLEEGPQLAEHDLEDAWTRWPGAGTVELRRGDDFDLCVCGISLGALPPVVQDLIEPSSPSYCREWAEMIEHTALCQTVSVQLWMERPQEQLYTPPEHYGVPPERGLLANYEPPIPSFTNFTKLIELESWSSRPEITAPAFLAYHTGSLSAGQPLRGVSFDDHEFPARTRAAFVQQAQAWFTAHYADFYDRAPRPFSAFCDQLVAPPQMRGVERFEWQHFNIGVQPWDLYVVTQPGTPKLRLGQDESWVEGLMLCGDWTRTDINAGCVEAATQSGMLCARAISAHPRYVWRVGF